jgi:hypothetical protein
VLGVWDFIDSSTSVLHDNSQSKICNHKSKIQNPSTDFTTYLAKPPLLSISALCAQKAATVVDLVIDTESFKLISLAILSIRTYSLPGGSQHEHI